MGNQAVELQLPRRDQLQQGRGRVVVDQPRLDRHTLDPEVLEMQGCWFPVDTDVRNSAPGPDQLGAQLEGLRDPDGLDRDVGSSATCELLELRDRILTR